MAELLSMSGAPELVRAARAAAAELREPTEADERVAQLVGPAAQAAAPVRTGRTANSMRWGATEAGAQVAVPVDWAVPLHTLNPWVADTYRRKEADIVQVYDDAVDTVVARFND